jgi:hypothetical protein
MDAALELAIISVFGFKAISMIIEMPELCTLDRNKAASFAGVAPFSRQSSKWRKGTDHVHGGRMFVRRVICMLALVAVQRNLQLKTKYNQLIETRTPPKLDLTAIMCPVIILKGAYSRTVGYGMENSLDEDRYTSVLLLRAAMSQNYSPPQFTWFVSRKLPLDTQCRMSFAICSGVGANDLDLSLI